MILYSIMPQEYIYPPDEREFQKQRVIEMNGVPILVNELNPGEHYIVQVMSSNPQDYLNEQFTPGSRITFRTE
ncbi:YlzJ-like family protein [Bacillus sp. PS06]|uniref:YlzJ-like family protein n=1 Tax=Bacillus sp. PS06 TaxID=2764176 RepID=UPI00177CB840|nr:YlzJ-like family protein [Bacillus sp. PS06]MBD8068243.1 YlzJ-like family protein [Bacillus sp. PS06]